jgi:hypothetical protein
MAERRESNISALNVKVNVDCSEALKGLKALTRAAKKATTALKELDEQVQKGFSTNNNTITPVNLDGKEIAKAINKVKLMEGIQFR